MMDRRTILHVEDEADDRLILRSVFSKVAPEVDLVPAIDGEDALRLLSASVCASGRPFDLVLLDLKLPRKSGFEVLEGARRVPGLEGLPIVVLTSSSEEGDIARAYELGATIYLVKSVDIRETREVAAGIAEYAKQASSIKH